MYLWKCWRDTRGAFLILLGVICLLGVVGSALVNDWGGLASHRAFSATWRETGLLLLTWPSVLTGLAAFLLGAVTLGDEYSRGTLSFLVTRPRQRPFLVWVNWLVGALAMVVLSLLSLAIYFSSPATLANMGGKFGFFAARASLLMLLVPLFLYSLTFFMTMLFKSGRYGSGAALLAVMSYMVIATWLAFSFDIRLPYSPGPFVHYWNHFPWEEMAAWLTAALLLAWGSRMIFVHREI